MYNQLEVDLSHKTNKAMHNDSILLIYIYTMMMSIYKTLNLEGEHRKSSYGYVVSMINSYMKKTDQAIFKIGDADDNQAALTSFISTYLQARSH